MNILNDYEKLSTTYQEYVRGIDITGHFEDKGRNRSKKSSRKNISDAKRRLSRLQRITDRYEKGLLQTVSPDFLKEDSMLKSSLNSNFLRSSDSKHK